MTTQTDEQLRTEIARLKGAISRQSHSGSSSASGNKGFGGAVKHHLSYSSRSTDAEQRNVVIDGMDFRASSRSLVRHQPTVSGDPPISSMSAANSSASQNVSSRFMKAKLPPINKQTSATSHPRTMRTNLPYASKAAFQRGVPPSRAFSRARARGGHRLLQSRPGALKKRVAAGRRNKATINKQCREFTRRGVCRNGLTCRYKHDANQVAICPKYLTDECTLPEGFCPLSHDPTPERVPVCVHFSATARCRNGNDCKYPHVRLGAKTGVCRDFAVLGFCIKGLDCGHQHVKECPDFAATGSCPIKACRLPHVIRAQHRVNPKLVPTSSSDLLSSTEERTLSPYAQAALQRDEFIPLTFEESDEDGEETSDEDNNLHEMDTGDDRSTH